MTNQQVNNKTFKAFVLMPFSVEFDDVFKHIICETIESIGFKTTRADEPKSSRNIMHDVIQGIIEADLIIADITGSNPNVYYELGIAHAKSKKVVLLVQDIDDVPFDLRAYRVITYSTHFARVAEAKAQLLETAENVLKTKDGFSNPVTDFYATQGLPLSNLEEDQLNQVQVMEDSEIGILDIFVDLEEGLNIMTEVMNDVGSGLNNLIPKIVDTTSIINSNIRSPKTQRIAVRSLANEIDTYANSLKSGNDKYRTGLLNATNSIDKIFNLYLAKTEEDQEELNTFRESIIGTEENAVSCRKATSELVDVLDGLPSIEKEFNRSKVRLSLEIKSLISNIDLTLSMMYRVKTATNLNQRIEHKP